MQILDSLLNVVLAGLVFGVGLPVIYVLALRMWDCADHVDSVIARRGTLAMAWTGFALVGIMVLVSFILLGVAPRTLGRQNADAVALAAARPDLVTFVPWSLARHCKEWNVDPERWERVVREFIS